MQLIDGNKISAEIREEIAKEVKIIIDKGGKKPHLAAILVGNDGASETYVAWKVKDCAQVGFESTLIRLPEETSEEELIQKIKEINSDENIDGLIVQLPIPKHISERKIIETIDPEKDVDGFHPINTGKLALGIPAFVSATPAGIMELFRRLNIETQGKNCAVIGRSNIVGTPMALLMSRKTNPGNSTVSICHSRTKDIASFTKEADIIIAALGMPEFLTADMVKEGAVVIDVGITRVKSDITKSGWKLIGDVKFDEVSPKCSWITPVPGGVGPMTRVALLKNTLLAASKR
ncbi:bifunctional 5,10-methylenetetrahydrofolate dehydrogenase/5,10-methenyltetrahydrofolate cyclohydrolase [Bacteroidota bacterium]